MRGSRKAGRLTTPVVRPAEVRDAGAMGAAFFEGELRALETSYPDGYPTEWFGRRSPDWCAHYWEYHARDPGEGCRVWVAEEAGGVTGLVHAGSSPEGGAPLIHALYVLPRAWGSGAASALLREALAWLGSAGYDGVALWVIEGNARARRFYEREGFVATGEFRRADNGLPLVRYERALLE